MGRKLRGKLTTTRGLVVIVGLVFAITFAMPAMGASPLKLAKKALAKATLALNTANDAKKSANTAQTTANTANTTANEAKTAAAAAGPRAFGRVDGSSCATSSTCPVDHSKGITSARETSTAGLYCVAASGLSQATDAWVTSADQGDSGAGTGTEQANPNSNNAACNADEFEVQTLREDSNASDISFFIVIP
jgi:hypothetical protein